MTQDEIKKIDVFLLRRAVLYQDVRMELVDHLASSIQAIRDQGSDHSFNDVLNEAYTNLGPTTLRQIVLQAEKSAKTHWRRRVVSFLRSFLAMPRLPLILGLWLLLFTLVYGCILDVGYILILPALLTVAYIFYSLYTAYVREEAMNKWLILKSYHQVMNLVVLTLYWIGWLISECISPETYSTISNSDWYSVFLLLICGLISVFFVILTGLFYVFPRWITQEWRAKKCRSSH